MGSLDIYVNKINPNFHEKKLPRSAQLGWWRVFSLILLVTELVTHYWLTVYLVEGGFFMYTQAIKCSYTHKVTYNSTVIKK
jgi:hypothetical protein